MPPVDGYHLRLMRECRAVRTRRHGQQVLYCLADVRLVGNHSRKVPSASLYQPQDLVVPLVVTLSTWRPRAERLRHTARENTAFSALFDP